MLVPFAAPKLFLVQDYWYQKLKLMLICDVQIASYLLLCYIILTGIQITIMKILLKNRNTKGA